MSHKVEELKNTSFLLLRWPAGAQVVRRAKVSWSWDTYLNHGHLDLYISSISKGILLLSLLAPASRE